MKSVCPWQPYFYPQLYYFNRVLHSDIYVFMDDVQFSPRTQHCRTYLKSPNGMVMRTAYVQKSRHRQLIYQVRLADDPWFDDFAMTVKRFYSKAKYFKMYFDYLVTEFKRCTTLYGMNSMVIRRTLELLGYTGKIMRESDLYIDTQKIKNQDLMLEVSLRTGADVHLAGKVALDGYMDVDKFKEKGVQVWVQDWKCPTYSQLWMKSSPDFIPNMSILDLLFNMGAEDARSILMEGDWCVEL